MMVNRRWLVQLLVVPGTGTGYDICVSVLYTEYSVPSTCTLKKDEEDTITTSLMRILQYKYSEYV